MVHHCERMEGEGNDWRTFFLIKPDYRGTEACSNCQSKSDL